MKLTTQLLDAMQFDFIEVVKVHHYAHEPWSVKETLFTIYDNGERCIIEGQMEQTLNEGHAIIAIMALEKGKIQIRVQ